MLANCCASPSHAGGFAVVTACDLAVVAEGATLGLPEAEHGLFPFLALAVAADTMPKKLFFEIVYQGRFLTAGEACALHLANAVVPREHVVTRAVELVERASRGNPDILMLGRDLYHATRGMTPSQALDQARVALGVALSARAERS